MATSKNDDLVIPPLAIHILFYFFFFYFFFFKFYFIFKLNITVLDLPNIKMNPPQVYMCSTLTHIGSGQLQVSSAHQCIISQRGKQNYT